MYDEIGCSSHMCLIQKPKGVGTNGPCLCNARKLRLKLTWQDVRIKQLGLECKDYRKAADFAVKENQKLRAENEDLIGQCDSSDQ